MFKRNFQAGFSLIELLVVISIIGILAGILVLSFDTARKNSRDAARKSDLQALQLAIELYKAQNGSYPKEGCSAPTTLWVGPGPLSGWGQGNCDDYIEGLVPDYIASLPKDPNHELDQDLGYIYRTNIDRSAFKVIVHQSIESQFITAQSDEFSRYPEICGISVGNLRANEYSVYSPGVECL